MTDLMSIVEGKSVSNSTAMMIVRQTAKKQGIPDSELIRKMEDTGTLGKDLVDVGELKNAYRSIAKRNDLDMGAMNASVKKMKSDSSGAADLANQVIDAGMKDDVLAKMDELGIGKEKGIFGKSLGALKGAAKGLGKGAETLGKFGSAVVGEGVINESEVSDELVRKFFEKLIAAFEKQGTVEGIRESIVDDFLDTSLDYSKLKSIMSIIDDNNANGAFNAVKDSILSKWGDSAMDTSTLRSISDELTSLSKKGITL